MRSVVLRNRIRNMLIVSSLGALSISLSACSSGFQRFDRSIYDEALPQHYSNSNSQNSYPGDVDYTTTASTRGAPLPAGGVGPAAVPQAVYHSPEPTYAQPQYRSSQPMSQSPVRQSYSGYTPAQPSVSTQRTSVSSGIQSSTLPKIEETLARQPSSSRSLNYSPPAPDSNPQTVYIPETTDTQTTTASVQPQNSRAAGWTGTGGTRLTVRQGETLYNLSKRYGVPVSAIRKANGLQSSASLKAGQSIVIPTYVYGPNATVSAPDNNPRTRAASASTGLIGEARDSIAVPSRKPALQGGARNIATKPTAISRGQSGASYTVRQGDSLSAIAERTGTTVSSLKAANNLSGNNIRIGQKLALPIGIDSTTTASVNSGTEGVDPIVTGAVTSDNTSSSATPATETSELEAPEQTGIAQFRWPVRGKVIEKFGENVAEGENEGIDISVPEGTAVRSAENGVVIYAGSEISEYGNLVLVRHTNGWVSAYAHNRSFEVKKGDRINRGQIIARSGKTGQTERPKLHFELRKESRAVDPLKHLAAL